MGLSFKKFGDFPFKKKINGNVFRKKINFLLGNTVIYAAKKRIKDNKTSMTGNPFNSSYVLRYRTGMLSKSYYFNATENSVKILANLGIAIYARIHELGGIVYKSFLMFIPLRGDILKYQKGMVFGIDYILTHRIRQKKRPNLLNSIKDTLHGTHRELLNNKIYKYVESLTK